METLIAQQPIRIAEELVLLLLDEQSGYLEMVPGWNFSCVMAGAVIADLALADRIDTDLETLYVVDSSPTRDDLLDATLRELVESEETADAQYWIERNARRADEIVEATLERLVERKILDYHMGGFWGHSRSVSRSGTYPASDVETRREAKARILDVVLNDVIPDPHDAILIALMHTCGGFKLILSQEDYDEKLEWIETIAKLELIGRTVATAVRESTATPKTRQVIQRKPIPKLRIIDVLRQPEFRTCNIPEAMFGLMQKHGPVLQLPVKMDGLPAVALMGVETNQWVNKRGRFYLRSKDYIKHFEAAFGASRTLPGMDGAEHYRMRKSLRSVYSRSTIARRLQEIFNYCRQSLGTWKEGDLLGATETFQHHISSQISNLAIGVDCSHYVQELLEFQHRALVTHVQGALPRFMLRTPKMRRYARRVQELQESVHASHTPAQRKGKPQDIADALLELHRSDPQFLPETDMTFPFVASMVASIYMGSALSFAMYSLVRNPDLYERVHREAAALFGGGRDPDAKDFTLENIDVTHRFCLESARLHPVIPWQMRTVMNQCVINGYEVPAQTRLVICQTATHYDDDFFKDPLKFDIDRYLPERAEHKVPGAYAPYGLGTHTCLGSRWVELQMAVNILLIAYHFRLEPVSTNGKLRINPFPTAAPTRKFKLRVTEITHPI